MHIEQPEVAPRDAYTHGHHESVLRIHSWRTVDNSAAYLAPHLREGAKVLDVGSGPGTISLDLARRVRPGTRHRRRRVERSGRACERARAQRGRLERRVPRR